jgi:hypothetical protein
MTRALATAPHAARSDGTKISLDRSSSRDPQLARTSRVSVLAARETPQGDAAGAALRRPCLSCSIAPSWGPPVPKRSEVEAALRRLAPRIPPHEFGAVVDHALDSRGLRSSPPEAAAWLSLVAYVRHALTDYDDLLTQGYDQDSARYFVAGEIESVLGEWGVRRRLGAQE